jgi:hypothetical protein
VTIAARFRPALRARARREFFERWIQALLEPFCAAASHAARVKTSIRCSMVLTLTPM